MRLRTTLPLCVLSVLVAACRGEVMTGVAGVTLTVTVTDAVFVDAQPFDAMTDRE